MYENESIWLIKGKETESLILRERVAVCLK